MFYPNMESNTFKILGNRFATQTSFEKMGKISNDYISFPGKCIEKDKNKKYH